MTMFDPDAFSRLLGNSGDGLGQNVSWRRSYECPCRSPTSGQARRDCLQCRGDGQIWTPPEPGPVWTGLAGLKVARDWASFGEFQKGDVVLTIPQDSPLWACGENDRITMIDSSQPFSLVLRRGKVDCLRGTIDLIERVFYLDPLSQAIVEAPIPPWDAEGTLDWTGIAGAPPDGIGYNVTGRMRPEYFIFKDLPQDRQHHYGMDLPRRVVARKFELMGRGRAPGHL